LQLILASLLATSFAYLDGKLMLILLCCLASFACCVQWKKRTVWGFVFSLSCCIRKYLWRRANGRELSYGIFSLQWKCFNL